MTTTTRTRGPQTRRAIHIRRDIADRFYERTAELGRPASAVLEELLANPKRAHLRGVAIRPVNATARRAKLVSERVLAAIPAAPEWVTLDEIRAATGYVRETIAAVVATLITRGLVRASERAQAWQRTGS